MITVPKKEWDGGTVMPFCAGQTGVFGTFGYVSEMI